MKNPANWRQGIAYRACFSLDTVSGTINVEFPDLPGCVASGGCFVEARDRAKRTLDAWIDASLVGGKTVAAPSAATGGIWISARSGFQQARATSTRRLSLM